MTLSKMVACGLSLDGNRIWLGHSSSGTRDVLKSKVNQELLKTFLNEHWLNIDLIVNETFSLEMSTSMSQIRRSYRAFVSGL